MAARDKKQRQSKTETLSIRLDPRTKFAAEFLARIWRQNTTAVVERCIRDAANRIEFGGWLDDEGNKHGQRRWPDYWHIEQGVREIFLYRDAQIPKTVEEEEKLEFVKWHIEFFSEVNDISSIDPMRVNILWNRIDEFVELWRDQSAGEIWAAGRLMGSELKRAGIEPPEWPRSTTSPPPSQKSSGDLDDEIPF